MIWECHECGTIHPQIPERCSKCSTPPEIVENEWECDVCKTKGLFAHNDHCTECGAGRDRKDRQRVSPDKKISTDVAIQIANGTTLQCAYCDAWIDPVDKEGKPNRMCQECGGAPKEASQQVSPQEVQGSEVEVFREVKTEKREGVSTSPPPPPIPPVEQWTTGGGSGNPLGSHTVTKFGIYFLIAAVVCGGLALIIYLTREYEGVVKVQAKEWVRSIDVERRFISHSSGWRDQMPIGAQTMGCSMRQRGTKKIIDGYDTIPMTKYDSCVRQEVRSVSVPQAGAKTCRSYSYSMRGKVSVKQCASWDTATTYRTENQKVCVGGNKIVLTQVERSHWIAVQDSYCEWEEDLGYRVVRSVQTSGSAAPLYWSETLNLASDERQGYRHQTLTLQVVGADLKEPQSVMVTSDLWDKVNISDKLQALIRLGHVTRVRP